jgi:ribosome-associated translation inhibitor RaiA
MSTQIHYGSVRKSKKLEKFVNDKVTIIFDKISDKKIFQIEVWMKDETGNESPPEFTSSFLIKTPVGKDIFVKRTDSNLYRSVKKSFSSAKKQLRQYSQILKSQESAARV